MNDNEAYEERDFFAKQSDILENTEPQYVAIMIVGFNSRVRNEEEDEVECCG
jgi:hypothetical protein